MNATRFDGDWSRADYLDAMGYTDCQVMTLATRCQHKTIPHLWDPRAEWPGGCAGLRETSWTLRAALNIYTALTRSYSRNKRRGCHTLLRAAVTSPRALCAVLGTTI